MMSAFETMSVFYECQRCTACCRWPGQVRLTDNEIGQLATHLGLFGDEFIQQYLRLTRDRRSLALMEKGNGECVFLRDRDCTVQTVKPRQCRDFPNLWNFPGFERECRAVAQTTASAEHPAGQSTHPADASRRNPDIASR